MNAAEITAAGSLLVALGTLAKIIFDNHRRAKRQDEQLEERRDSRVSRLSDAFFDRLQAEMARADKRLEDYERRHAEDQRRIAELENGRLKREMEFIELGARINKVDKKMDALSTGVFQQLERADHGR